MENKYQHDFNLSQWVNEFEILTQQGEKTTFDIRIYQKLIEYYQNEGDLKKAVNVADSALYQYGYRVDFYLVKCRLLLSLKQPLGALECLHQAEQLHPQDTDVLLTKALILSDLKDKNAALSLLHDLKSYVGQSDLVEVMICETEVYFQAEEYHKGFVTLKNALRADAYHERGQQLLSDYISSSRNYALIAQFLQEMLENAPYSHFAWYNLGHCYSNLGEYAQAVDAFEYAFLIKPQFEQAYIDCAETCVLLRQWDKALSVYQEVMNTFGEEYDLIISIAECCIQLKDIKLAKKFINQSLKLDVFGEEAHFLMGQCFSLEDKWYKAIQCYRRAISLDETSDTYYMALAKAYAQVGDNDKAHRNFKKATIAAPEQNSYWFEHAKFLLKQGKTQPALEILDQGEISSVGTDLLYCRAAIHYLLGNKTKSIDILAEVLEDDFSGHACIFDLAPDMAQDRDILSIINYYKGEIFE
ncbi:MAG: tetratricopeptide repeat protein [Saprospiraceae bacterium]